MIVSLLLILNGGRECRTCVGPYLNELIWTSERANKLSLNLYSNMYYIDLFMKSHESNFIFAEFYEFRDKKIRRKCKKPDNLVNLFHTFCEV